jgi:hypothetical protein
MEPIPIVYTLIFDSSDSPAATIGSIPIFALPSVRRMIAFSGLFHPE